MVLLSVVLEGFVLWADGLILGRQEVFDFFSIYFFEFFFLFFLSEEEALDLVEESFSLVGLAGLVLEGLVNLVGLVWSNSLVAVGGSVLGDEVFNFFLIEFNFEFFLFFLFFFSEEEALDLVEESFSLVGLARLVFESLVDLVGLVGSNGFVVVGSVLDDEVFDFFRIELFFFVKDTSSLVRLAGLVSLVLVGLVNLVGLVWLRINLSRTNFKSNGYMLIKTI